MQNKKLIIFTRVYHTHYETAYNMFKENKVFGLEYNKISIITKDKVKNFQKMTKVNCAKKIIQYIYNLQL